ncbi:MAG: EamA family transporter [Massilia sp.]|nr:EamA family transporter [Massilia sp.]
MGELLALCSACCFAAANVTITRGAGARGQDNGAFLSILLTAAIAGALWLMQSAARGFPAMRLSSMLWFAGAGFLTLFIGRVFLYASVQHLGAVPASAVKRLNPLFSVLLGVLLLGEAFDNGMALGMLLIVASFAVLIGQSLKAAAQSGGNQKVRSLGATLANLGYFYGPVSALAYAFGYVARKEGLAGMPDPAFGTMFGSIVGALVFVLIARFVDSYRVALRQTFTAFNPWLFAAGVLSSAGQLLYFAALSSTSIARCAMLSSMEAFFTIFFTVVVTRSYKQLTAPVLLACALGVAGTAFIVLK